jgi:hypothetical protein
MVGGSQKKEQGWQAAGRMDKGKEMPPQCSYTSSTLPYTSSTLPYTSSTLLGSPYLGLGLRSQWGKGQIPTGPTPAPPPSSSVNKRTHSLWPMEEANPAGAGSCKPSLRPFLSAFSWAASQLHPRLVGRWGGAPMAPRPRAREPYEPGARRAHWNPLQMALAVGPARTPWLLKLAGPICPHTLPNKAGINTPRFPACQPVALPVRSPSG